MGHPVAEAREPSHDTREGSTLSILAQIRVPERRYTDEEVRLILSNAVEVDSSMAAEAERGLTLAQIQRVAAEAGLSPASVAAAAATLDQEARTPAPPRVFGLPVGVGSTVVLPGPLSHGDWRQLVTFLQDTFEAKGREEQGAGRRQWWNGNLRIAVDEVDGTTLLHLRTRKESAGSFIRGGGSLMIGSIILGAGSALILDGAIATAAVAMGLGGLGMASVGAVQLPTWSAMRKKQFDAVAQFARALSAREKDGAS